MKIVNARAKFGYAGERNIPKIKYLIENEYLNKVIYLNIESPVGNYRFRVSSNKNNQEFYIPSIVLQRQGELRAQLEVIVNNITIDKSDIATFQIVSAIDNSKAASISTYFPLESIVINQGKEQSITPSQGFYGIGLVQTTPINLEFSSEEPSDKGKVWIQTTDPNAKRYVYNQDKKEWEEI